MDIWMDNWTQKKIEEQTRRRIIWVGRMCEHNRLSGFLKFANFKTNKKVQKRRERDGHREMDIWMDNWTQKR